MQLVSPPYRPLVKRALDVCLGAMLMCATLFTVTLILGHIPLQMRVDRWMSKFPFGQTYERTVVLHSRRMAMSCGADVYLGDSITFGLATSAVTAGPTENLAIGGDTIEGMIYRAPRYHLGCARHVIIAIGINNCCNYQPADFGHKYRQLLAEIPLSIPVVANALFPMDPVRARKYLPVDQSASEIRRANELIRQACRLRPSCHFLDVSAKMLGADGVVRAEYLTEDGFHPSTLGYEIWINELRQLLSPASAT